VPELSSNASADDRELCQGKEDQGCDHIRNLTCMRVIHSN